MANGLLGAADLANNIASATKGLATALGLANPEPKFPETKESAITADFQREHWYTNPSQGLYSFSVEPVGTGTVSEFPAFVDNIVSLFTSFFDDNHFGEFKLPITPQEINQTEDFAVSIKPTQGGTVVNHSGNRYKTLTISGTTGVQPNRGLLGVFKGSGLAIGKPDDIQYRSGYEVFQHFRQWMRAYHEEKSKPGRASLRMMFRNYKDWEFLYVEPIKFSMKRDANKPLLYNYHIQLKVLGVHTINKPLFELVISKLTQVAEAMTNAVVLIKTNNAVTQWATGTMDDILQSLNGLTYALNASAYKPLTFAQVSKSDVQKLSYKETLKVLNSVGKAFSETVSNPGAAEKNGTTVNDPDPAATGLALTTLAANPSYSNPQAAQAQLLSVMDTEPALMTGISLTSLPQTLVDSIKQQQATAALMSPVQVKSIQDKVQDISDQLADSLGLGDDTYNQLFGLTPTVGIETQNELTDAQFEMLYGLSQVINSIDGILSSDEMFDINAKLFSQTGAINGADSVGSGIFSFPDPNSGIKEGYLSAGQTLEDLALSELGDASRWTEIAELNGLKAPYIATSSELLSPSFEVESQNFSNPNQIYDLQIGYRFVITNTPVPAGAWAGKGKYIAEFLGGDQTLSSNWRFVFPDDGMLLKITSTGEYIRFLENIWETVDVSEYELDGVIKPGDKIRIPGRTTPPPTTPLQGRRDNPYTNSLTSGEKSLSVDLRLNTNLDIDLTASGDLNVAYGTHNGAQAIVLKLLYEKGSLKKFPKVGTNLTPGKTMPDIATLRADVSASLLQDTRIKRVTKINLIQENSTTTLSFDVYFNDIAQPIPVTIPV